MKLRIILMILLLSMFVVGCSFANENKLVEQGQSLLEKHDYEKAKEILSQALESDSEDEYARAMYMQSMRMEKAIKYEQQGKYKKAVKELEFIENLKYGLDAIKDEASSKKKELLKLNEEYEKVQSQRKESAKESSSKDQHRVHQQMIKEQQRVLEQLEAQKKKEEEQNKDEIINGNSNEDSDILIKPESNVE